MRHDAAQIRSARLATGWRRSVRVATTALGIFTFGATQAVSAQPLPVTVDLQFALTMPGDAPAAAAPVRMVLAPQPQKSAPGAGVNFQTDANGRYTARVAATITEMRRKKPTAFWPQLVARPERTRHFSVGAELPYAGQQWLYVIELDYFEGGTTARIDAMRVYARDDTGAYTREATLRDGAYTMPGLGTLTTPGYTVAKAMLEPGAGGNQWKLTLALARAPEPVRR